MSSAKISVLKTLFFNFEKTKLNNNIYKNDIAFLFI